MHTSPNIRFFLGANTPNGFISRFDQLSGTDGDYCGYIIKGGPGTGKSSFMKKVAKAFIEQGADIECIHCASDPASLDAVIIHDKKLYLADGTAPHIMEPRYPGAVDNIINLLQYVDADKLKKDREAVTDLTNKNKGAHERCCRFLSAAGSLINDSYQLSMDATDPEKLEAYVARLAKHEMPAIGGTGKEKLRFFNAVTQDGITMFTDTINALCERIYLIDDEYGASSKLLISELRERAIKSGYDVISALSPTSPFEKREHIIIPQLSLGFVSGFFFHTPDITPTKIINCRRFTDYDKLKVRMKRLSFNKKATSDLLSEASRMLGEAKIIHDELEKYYIAAADFEAIDRFGKNFIASIIK